MGKRKIANSTVVTAKKAKTTTVASGTTTTTTASSSSTTAVAAGTTASTITSAALKDYPYTKDYDMKVPAILFFRRLQSKYGGKKRTPKLLDELCEEIIGQICGDVDPYDIKTVLKLNDQAAGGNDREITSRLADGILRGGLPRCPKCFGGRLRYGMPKWESSKYKGKAKRDSPLKGRERFHCPGFFDDDRYVNCTFEALDGIERLPWKYP
ncbi:uncharacterized protein [Branchiostoma lanceolatum]|uniref:uncharacterized protein n=1 Tax=Branchiostoma lanceolatum TaxID=7740 RepID=UPI003451A2FB